MALNKKKIGCLSVAALAGGLIIGEGIGLYNLQGEVDSLKTNKTKLEKTINNLNNDVKLKDKSINDLNKEKSDFQNSIEELEKKNKKLEQQLEAKKQKEASAMLASAELPTSRSSVGSPVQMTLTFYGGGAEENGGYAGMNAYSGKLTAGTVASNVYPRGTQFKLPNGQILTVNDRGGSNFNSYNRLDVYVPKLPGEDKHQYDKRISNYGRKTLTVYKL